MMAPNSSSWWFQPIWKILVKLDHLPRVSGWRQKSKNACCSKLLMRELTLHRCTAGLQRLESFWLCITFYLIKVSDDNSLKDFSPICFVAAGNAEWLKAQCLSTGNVPDCMVMPALCNADPTLATVQGLAACGVGAVCDSVPSPSWFKCQVSLWTRQGA